MESELLTLQESNSHIIQQKRQIEHERNELEEQLKRGGQMSTEEKRRFETQIQRLEEDFEEAESNIELANEKLRKAQQQVYIFLNIIIIFIQSFR